MRKDIVKIAGILLLVISLTACGQGAAPTAAPTDANAQPAATPVNQQPASPCANDYFPVKENAVYRYSSTGSPSGPYTFTRKIKNVAADSFVVTSVLKKSELTQTWSCKPEGLVPSQLGITDATSILAFEKFTNLTASNITGFVLPPTITEGAEWSHAMDIQGTEAVQPGGSNPATMTGRVSITYTAGKKESVTVPAGTFDAIAIEVNTVIDFNVVNGSNTVKLSINSTYTVWYAPGVGWVKSSGHGKLGGQDYVETIVLESYKIP